MADKSIIQIRHVDVNYGPISVLKGIDLDIYKGKIVAFLGPSGSGKTTLIKAIMGMQTPSHGSVTLLDKKMPSFAVSSHIGYMAQNDALYEDLSGLDNLLFFSALYGLRGKTAQTRAAEILKLVNLENSALKKVRTYSGGMKRRLSLGIALVHNPRIIILDEPTVGIDPVLRKVFWEEFIRLKHSDITIIITTHAMDEAYRCDRLALIREGRIIADNTPDGLMKESGTSSIEDAFLYYSEDRGTAQ